MGIFSKIKIKTTLLPQLFIVISAFIIMIFLGSYFCSLIVNKYISRYGDEIISVSAETIKTYLHSYEITINDTVFIIEWLRSQNSSAARMQDTLNNWYNWLPSNDEDLTEIISIYGYIDGNYITTSGWTYPEEYDPQSRIWYKGAYEAQGAIFCSNPYIDYRTGESITSFSKLVFDENGEAVGVMSLDVFISVISDYVTQIQLMDSGYGILLDSEKRVIVHPIPDFFGLTLDNAASVSYSAETREIIKNRPDAVTSASVNPEHSDAIIHDAGILSGYGQMLKLLDTDEGVSAFDFVTASGEKIVVFMREFYNGWVLGLALPSDIYYQDIKVIRAILTIAGIFLSLLLCGVLTFMHIAKSRSDSASRVKSDFLANMSHEIRTPMNSIIGMTELLEHEDLTARQRDYIKDIDASANSLLSIINDILDLSKIESGKIMLNPINYDFQAMLDNIKSMFNYVSQKKGLEFKFVTAGEIPKILYGDDIRLRQVLTNICGNAVKYTETGYIRLKVSTLGNKIVFEVKDTGMGIKKESMPQIFNAFEQDKTERNRHIAGTGLGLPICKAFVEMMDGSIMLDSEYEHGTVVTVIIPLVLGIETDVNYEDKTKSKLNLYAPDAKVLLVDDNEFNLKVAHGLLLLHSIDAVKSTSGFEAIDLVKKNDFDIIFMDHMMPDMDGIETVAEIRKLGDKYKTLPIVALTANAVQGAKEMFLLNDFNDFISKPIDMQKLTEILIEWLPNEKIIQIKEEDHSKDAIHSKILYAVNSGTGKHRNESSSLQDAVINNLYALEDLDVNAGLSYIGQNKESYLDLLRFFTDNCNTYILELLNTMKEENWAHYAVKSHALKGVLANIGASDLSKWAAKLEKASKIEDLSICRDETDSFCKKLSLFKERLIKILETGKTNQTVEASSAARLGTDRILNELMTLLKEACANFSFTETKNIIAILDEYKWEDDINENLNKIKGFINSFEYQKANEYAFQILENSAKGEKNV